MAWCMWTIHTSIFKVEGLIVDGAVHDAMILIGKAIVDGHSDMVHPDLDVVNEGVVNTAVGHHVGQHKPSQSVQSNKIIYILEFSVKGWGKGLIDQVRTGSQRFSWSHAQRRSQAGFRAP